MGNILEKRLTSNNHIPIVWGKVVRDSVALKPLLNSSVVENVFNFFSINNAF